jgi:hypothetical protein
LSSHLRLGLPSGLFPSGFPTNIPHAFSSHSCYMPCPSHPPWLDNSNYVCEEYKLWSSSLSSSPFGPNILLKLYNNKILKWCNVNQECTIHLRKLIWPHALTVNRRISGYLPISHRGTLIGFNNMDSDEYCFLGCDTVWSGSSLSTLHSIILLDFWGIKLLYSEDRGSIFRQNVGVNPPTTRRHIPEHSNLTVTLWELLGALHL